jgi:peroxiredoxin
MRRIALLSSALVMMALAAGPALAQMEPPKLGEPAPEFQLKDVQGNTHQLSDFEGNIVVLHFQQISCPWEKAYQPYFNELAQQYGDADTPVQFLAINSNKTESVDQLKQAKQNRPVAYPILKDPGNQVADQYAARVTPHMYVIDAEGTLRYRGGVEALPPSPSKATNMDEQYLKPVLDALVQGSGLPYTVTKAKGCGIKRVN